MMYQNKNNKRFLKCTLVSMIIITFVCLIHISGTLAQWSPYTYNPGYGYLPGGPYGGYFEYSEPVRFWGPVLGSFLPHPSFLPPPGTPLPAPGTPIPREIIELGASSNFNTAMEGYRLSIPYYLSDIMSGWTPWRSSSYYPGYTAPGGYTPFISMPYYSSPSGPFSSYYPKFAPTSFSYYGPPSYSSTYDSSSKGNTIVTITGKVVGSYSINSNGREIKCYVHLPQQAVFQPLDLSEYMGEIVEVSGYLINQDLYGASIERVI